MKKNTIYKFSALLCLTLLLSTTLPNPHIPPHILSIEYIDREERH